MWKVEVSWILIEKGQSLLEITVKTIIINLLLYCSKFDKQRQDEFTFIVNLASSFFIVQVIYHK